MIPVIFVFEFDIRLFYIYNLNMTFDILYRGFIRKILTIENNDDILKKSIRKKKELFETLGMHIHFGL